MDTTILKEHIKSLPEKVREELTNSLAYLPAQAIEQNSLLELFEAADLAKHEKEGGV